MTLKSENRRRARANDPNFYQSLPSIRRGSIPPNAESFCFASFETLFTFLTNCYNKRKNLSGRPRFQEVHGQRTSRRFPHTVRNSSSLRHCQGELEEKEKIRKFFCRALATWSRPTSQTSPTTSSTLSSTTRPSNCSSYIIVHRNVYKVLCCSNCPVAFAAEIARETKRLHFLSLQMPVSPDPWHDLFPVATVVPL